MMVLTTALLLAGCEASQTKVGSPESGGRGNAIADAPPGSDRRIGAVVGWRDRLYVLTKVNLVDIGQELDRVIYHGTLGEGFVVVKIQRVDHTIAIAMQSLDGEVFAAVAVQGGRLSRQAGQTGGLWALKPNRTVTAGLSLLEASRGAWGEESAFSSGLLLGHRDRLRRMREERAQLVILQPSLRIHRGLPS